MRVPIGKVSRAVPPIPWTKKNPGTPWSPDLTRTRGGTFGTGDSDTVAVYMMAGAEANRRRRPRRCFRTHRSGIACFAAPISPPRPDADARCCNRDGSLSRLDAETDGAE